MTLVSREVAGICEWELWEDSTIGSDHYPIFSKVHVNSEIQAEEREAKWIFNKAKYLWELESEEIDLNQDIEKVDERLGEVILKAANLSIPTSKGKMNRKAVPWRAEECSKDIKDWNRAFEILKRSRNYK